MGYKRIPENPNKPICNLTTELGRKDCIVEKVRWALIGAEQRDKSMEWAQRCYGQKLNYKRRLQLAFKYVEVR